MRIYLTANSPATLEARTSAAAPVVSDLVKGGLAITDFGPDITVGKFYVGVRKRDDATSAKIRAALGADVLIYDTSGQAPSYPASRSFDSAPWFGGDFIKGSRRDNPSVLGDCSGGFVVHSAIGYDYMSTAGHCFQMRLMC